MSYRWIFFLGSFAITILSRLWVILNLDGMVSDEKVLTVIVPCYNCERWLDETLTSLSSQSFQDFNTIIVDDGSKIPVDQQKLSLKMKNLRIIRHWKNMGLSAARNTGVIASKGSRYIVFLDPDDLIEPTAIEKMIIKMEMEQNPRCAFVYPGVVHFRSDESNNGIKTVIGMEMQQYDREALRKSNYLTSFALINRDIYLAAGGMCEGKIRWWEDYDFWLRLANLGFHGEFLAEPLFWYRRHFNGRSSFINHHVEERRWRAELALNNPFGMPDFEDELADHLTNVPPCYRKLDDSIFALLSRQDRLMYWMYQLLKRKQPSTYKVLSSIGKQTTDIGKLVMRATRKHSESILFIIPWMQVGGADTYDLNMMNHLKHKMNIIVLTEINVDEHQNMGAFSRITNDIFHIPTLIDSLHPDHDEAVNELITYLVKSRNVSKVYCRNAFAGYRFFKHAVEVGLKERLNLKFYDVQHLFETVDDGGWEHTTIPYHAFIDQRIFISEAMLARQLELLPSGTSSDKFHIVPPSVDISFWDPERFPCESFTYTTILFIGRVDEQKDPLKWLRIAKGLQAEDVKFLVIGDGPLLDQMRHEASTFPKIQFTGSFLEPEKIAEVLVRGTIDPSEPCRRTILLLTSRNEGIPIVVLEAIAMGIPVVAPPVGAVKEAMLASDGLLKISNSSQEADLISSLNEVLSTRTRRLTVTKQFHDQFSHQSFYSRLDKVFSL